MHTHARTRARERPHKYMSSRERTPARTHTCTHALTHAKGTCGGAGCGPQTADVGGAMEYLANNSPGRRSDAPCGRRGAACDSSLRRRDAGAEPWEPDSGVITPAHFSAGTMGLGADVLRGIPPRVLQTRPRSRSRSPGPHPQRRGGRASPPRPGFAKLITPFSVMISGARPGGWREGRYSQQ